MITGIDVSHFQGLVRWEYVKQAGIDFAYAKASQGSSWVDPQFINNMNGMRKVALPNGAYHFFSSGISGEVQAANFLSIIDKTGPGDLPPMLDVEVSHSTPQVILPEIESWLSKIESALGKKPIIYTNAQFWNNQVSTNFGGEYPLWIANYGVDNPTIPKAWKNWTIWQYSPTGTIPGINGDVDHDKCLVSLEELKNL